MTTFLLLLATSAQVTDIQIDVARQSPISPYIYGANYPNNWIYDWLKEWDAHHDAFTFARWSGNRSTAYNWETNHSNAGADYFHQNDNYLGASDEPGWPVRHFLRAAQGVGAAAMVTVPILGYVSADKVAEMGGVRDVAKTPDYLSVRFHKSFPSKPGRAPQVPPDLTDRAVYQDGFVKWVESVRSAKTPVFYSLDNEPDFWSHTHARLMPSKPTYETIIGKNIEYARMIKSIAPNAKVFGPVNYGWQGMRTFQDAPDANGRFFVAAYLDAIREASRKAGRRLVDVYDFHLYPEARGDGVRIIYSQAPDKPGTEVARIQAPRSLWDPTYTEDSWIPGSLGGQPIRLLPRMQEIIDQHYPGTKLAITEYEYGARDKISGGLAQADALGVFGRQGLFAASHWGVDHKEKPVYAAFQAFRNFDRRGSAFGDLGLAVSGENPELHSVYASLDSKNRKRLTVVAINKTKSAQTFRLGTGKFHPKSVRSYVISDGVYDTPGAGEASVAERTVVLVAPPLSIVTAEVMAK